MATEGSSDRVVDEQGTLWIIEGSCEGITRLVRGWGAATERKLVVFGKEKLRDATPEEWARYVARNDRIGPHG